MFGDGSRNSHSESGMETFKLCECEYTQKEEDLQLTDGITTATLSGVSFNSAAVLAPPVLNCVFSSKHALVSHWLSVEAQGNVARDAWKFKRIHGFGNATVL